MDLLGLLGLLCLEDFLGFNDFLDFTGFMSFTGFVDLDCLVVATGIFEALTGLTDLATTDLLLTAGSGGNPISLRENRNVEK